MKIDINCDMGESFGLYKMGDDEGIMPFITEANIACGFHASDPNHMHKTVNLAKQWKVNIGAHFSLPDLSGFGRREMKIEREELTNIIFYQVGALTSFLNLAGVPLAHLKSHGALYGMASRQLHVAEAVADVAEHYKVPVIGMADTIQEEVCMSRKIPFKAEFFPDLEYDDQGNLLITREHQFVDPKKAAETCLRAINKGLVRSNSGKDVKVRVETICVHSDTPNATKIAEEIAKLIQL